MTTKLAVPPAPPPPVAVQPAVPQSWQEAFNYLTDRFMRVIGKQAADIKVLLTGLEDARGLIAAGDRARAELQTRLDQAVAALDGVRDSFSSSLAAHEASITERLNRFRDAVVARDERIDAIERQVKDDGAAIQTILTGCAKTEATISDVADRIDATVEALSERVTVVVRRADGLDVQLDAIEPRLVAVADLLTATGERLDAEARGRAELAGAVERTDGAITTVSDRVAALGDTVDGLVTGIGDEVRARAAAVAAVARTVEELSETASQADAELDDKLTQLHGRAEAIERGVKLVDEAHGITAGRLRDLDDTVAAVRRETQAHALAIEDDRTRLGKVEDGVEGFVRITAAAGAEIATFDQRLTTISAEAADACRRVTIALGEMPAAMMINRAGHLVRVSRGGDEVDLGCVVTNAKDAADIVAARIEKGRLVFTRSDRTEFGCEMPVIEPPAATPVPAVDPTALGYLSKDPNVRAAQVEDMKAMRVAKKTYEKIGEKYGTSARHVVRLLKGDDK